MQKEGLERYSEQISVDPVPLKQVQTGLSKTVPLKHVHNNNNNNNNNNKCNEIQKSKKEKREKECYKKG
jgi:hypothetical protein